VVRLKQLTEISIEITNKCTQRCRHCSSNGGDSFENELTLEEVQRVIDEAQELGAYILTLSGGDPCLRSDLFEIIAYARNKSFEIRLQTSGVYSFYGMNIISIPVEFLEKFKKNIGPKDKIVYSLLGLRENHEYMTTIKGSFDVVFESIKKTLEYGIFTEVHTVATSLNFRELNSILKVLEEKHVDSWHLLRLVLQGRCLENVDINLNREQFRELQQTLLTMHSEKVEIHLGHNIDKRYWIDESMPIHGCPIGKDKMLVKPNGDVIYCAALKKRPAGNIRAVSLNYCWNESSDALDFGFFQGSKFPTLMKGKCHDCPIVKECRGGCIAQRVHLYDGMEQGPDPMCFK
jgi:radical SAM protein with 4Fe4S-binding SPASM domain